MRTICWSNGTSGQRLQSPLVMMAPVEVGPELYKDIHSANAHFGGSFVDETLIALSSGFVTAWSVKNELRLGDGHDTTCIKLRPRPTGMEIGVNRGRVGFENRTGAYTRMQPEGAQSYWLETVRSVAELSKCVLGVMRESSRYQGVPSPGFRDSVKVPLGHENPARSQVTVWEFYRDPAVRAWVLATAAGRCESCNQYAPFIDRDGNPYLEVHHVVSLADVGADTIWNAVAVCPNCHRRCHAGADALEVTKALCEQLRQRPGP